MLSQAKADAARKNGALGGRPSGRKNTATLEREAVQRAVDQRVMQLADRLLQAQLAVAEGVSFLMRKPKTGTGKTTVVRDEHTIRKYFDGDLEADEADWYFIAAERPNADAADRLLNRGLGKPTEHVHHSGQISAPQAVTFVFQVQDGYK